MQHVLSGVLGGGVDESLIADQYDDPDEGAARAAAAIAAQAMARLANRSE